MFEVLLEVNSRPSSRPSSAKAFPRLAKLCQAPKPCFTMPKLADSRVSCNASRRALAVDSLGCRHSGWDGHVGTCFAYCFVAASRSSLWLHTQHQVGTHAFPTALWLIRRRASDCRHSSASPFRSCSGDVPVLVAIGRQIFEIETQRLWQATEL